jgi:L-fuconolactonase
MSIIDAQIHPPSSVAYWEYGDGSQAVLSCELAREAMDSVGVDAALVNAPEPVCTTFVCRYPKRFAGCVTIDAATGRELIVSLHDHPGILAVRAVLRNWVDGQATPEFATGRYDSVFEAAESRGVVVFVLAAGYIRALAPIATKYKDLRIVLDHIGLHQQPGPVAEDPWEDLPQVLDMAVYQNVTIKLSGATSLSRVPYPHHDVQPHIRRLIDTFGADRIMWGSDFTRLRCAPRSIERGPRAGWYGTYSDAVGLLRNASWISEAEKKMILGGTIRRLLKWPAGAAEG